MYSDTIDKFADNGMHKAETLRRRPLAFLVGSALAGAYIGFGDIILFTVGAHADPAWAHLVMGSVFAAALTIVIFAGSELFTGMTMYMPLAVMRGSSTVTSLLLVWIVCWIGNLVGAAVLALLLHLAGGGVLLTDGSTTFYAIVTAKMNAPSLALFARGILCNWLVCLAIWMCGRTENDTAKVFLIFWPIMIFVASGFEHCVANMFAFTMALFGPHPDTITWYGAFHNLLWVTLGNVVGGGVFVAFAYWTQDSRLVRSAAPAAKAASSVGARGSSH
ncbi:formate/nitrite transporter family protein [Rhizobium sp. BK251]|uniref:formate/nitrite transporter family protein n=1 Tax=Rhizobium sp. BK251 TaxID=2512125 RepID=UPI00105076FF|nr:formate/nitrite transporter family protein [Rhizobium sp. BK251]TCL65155.1 nitrite transporter NirC [Rhizobium sp. BK251]